MMTLQTNRRLHTLLEKTSGWVPDTTKKIQNLSTRMIIFEYPEKQAKRRRDGFIVKRGAKQKHIAPVSRGNTKLHPHEGPTPVLFRLWQLRLSRGTPVQAVAVAVAVAVVVAVAVAVAVAVGGGG